jgi:hypothetical protein
MMRVDTECTNPQQNITNNNEAISLQILYNVCEDMMMTTNHQNYYHKPQDIEKRKEYINEGKDS